MKYLPHLKKQQEENEMAQKDILDLATIKRMEAFFPILVRQAKSRRTIEYKVLMDEAIKNQSVERLLNPLIGRTLEWFRYFCRQNDLPDITSIVVRKDTQRPGDGFLGNCGFTGKFEESRDTCFECIDWCELKFPIFLSELARHIGKERSEICKIYCP